MERHILVKAIKILTIAVFLFLAAGRTMAQSETPSPTPESEEIKRLKEEKTRAELEKDIAVAEKAELDARFPKPTSSPLAGETKVNDGAVIESEMVSYVSMAYAANRIVAKLRDTPNLNLRNLAIYNRADIDLLLNYKATTAQLKILKQEFCNVLLPKPPQCTDNKSQGKASIAPLGIIGSFLGAFVDLTALLRTNVTVQGHTFSIDEAALVSEVFRAIRARDGITGNPNLYYPATFPPTDPTIEGSALLTVLEELHDLKALVLASTNDFEESLKMITKKKGEIKQLKDFRENGPQQILAAQAVLKRLEELQEEEATHKRRLPFEALERMKQLRATIITLQADLAGATAAQTKAEAELKNLENGLNEDKRKELLARMKTVNERFDNLVATLIKTDSATGINSLTAYIRAENLKKVMSEDVEQKPDDKPKAEDKPKPPKPRSYWLQLAVVKAGGNNRIKTNLLIDIFTGGSRLSHSGGVIVQYNLYDLEGKSIISDTLTEYTGYTKAGRIKRLINPVNVEDIPPRTPAHP